MVVVRQEGESYGPSICISRNGSVHVPREKRSPQSTGRQLRNAQTFIDMRTEELMLNWKLCMEGKDVVWVDPIR